MLRSAIWLLFAFAAAVVLALVLRMNHGNISILWPPYRIELSTNMALVLAIVGFFVLHVLLIAFARMLALPARVRQFRERRRHAKAGRALQGAVLAMYEGRFDRAEKLASAATLDGMATGAAALIAARSAHRLGDSARRDEWLRRAADSNPGHAAALMAQAEFALEDERPERALDAVDKMNVGGAQQLLALEASLAAYRQSGRWDRVIETVRLLAKRGRIAEPEARRMRLDAYQHLLAPCGNDAVRIRELWRSLRSEERKSADLAAPTVVALANAGAADDARKIALAVLDKTYDEATVEAYASLEALASRIRLEQLERWRTRHGDQPKLLEMLGRLCASEHLWGKAETYLLRSLEVGDTISARVALAQLYESIGRPADASRQFQFAARMALGERPALLMAQQAPDGEAVDGAVAPGGPPAGAAGTEAPVSTPVGAQPVAPAGTTPSAATPSAQSAPVVASQAVPSPAGTGTGSGRP
ncbi:MAG: heme biosynthesis HemY N-terminal domain-containing protein [Lautropia sp.]